ncbi:MAG: SRPBCC family protein [bacterium]
MGSASGSESITINAPLDDVMAAIRDLPSQPQWFPGLISSTVLATDDEGRATRARQVNDVKVAKDEYELDYTYTDSGMSWTLASASKAQKSSRGSWSLAPAGSGTKATLSLEIEPAIPLPGFLVKKTMNDMLKGATKGLKKYCES